MWPSPVPTKYAKQFAKSLFKCLTYLSQDRDIPLLRATYPCILELIATKKQGQARSNLFERVLKEGILAGFRYAGQKIKFLPILLRHIPTLYDELGSIGVQYLKALVPALCSAMAMPSNHNPIIKEINQLAATSLVALIKKCWPCIPLYRGLIMHSLAKTWTYYFAAKGKYEAMCQTLKQLYQVFEAACQGQEKEDTKALIKYNPVVFESLFCM
ncbi:hypothetical protein BD408DRAFT_346280 [Parasitella parasitica]|nr:hypothetical protein BD408DRAFT_346280 [Parasitella parasitica]